MEQRYTVTREIQACPNTPGNIRQRMDYWLEIWWQSSPWLTLVQGYAWWVPRDAGNTGVLFPADHPTRTNDERALTHPVLTDAIMSGRSAPGHLNWDYPLVMDADTILFGAMQGVMGWHVWGDRIEHCGLVFVDGHVRLNPAEDIRTHHPGYYQNLY